IWDWDLKSDVVWWSDGMETLFGYALEDLEPDSRSWTNRIHPEDREWVVESFFETVEKGLDRWESAYRFLCHDGSVAHVVDRGFVIRDKTGKAIRLVGGMTD